MKNRETWKPSKYVYRKGKLRASGDLAEVHAGSRLAADLIASLYGANLPKYARGRLLDLGCGKAPLFEAYRDYVSDNVCVDWTETRHGNEYLDYECDLTKRLPFGDGEFDTLILSDVLEHIPEPEILWREMHRVLAPGGRVLLNVPFCYPLHEEPHDYYRYTEYSLRRFAGRASFEVLLLRPVGGTPEIVADILAKHLQFLPLIGRGLAVMIQRLASAFVGTAPGRRLSEKTGRKYPLGYFLVAEKTGPPVGG